MRRLPEEFVVRSVESSDLTQVAAIYAHYVTRTVVTCDVDPLSVGAWQQRCADLRAADWPFLVGTVDGRVAGYAYVAPWRTRAAYRHTVEDSIYLAPEHVGRGYGRLLLERLLVGAAAAGAHQVIAVIPDSGNPASASLHEAVGFIEAGRLGAVGHKHGRWLDVVLMQASLTALRQQIRGRGV